MTILDEIQSDLRAVTVDDIKRARQSLDAVKPGEQILCEIQSEVALRLWALALKYARRSSVSLHTGRDEAGDAHAQRDLLRDSSRLAAQAALAREAAWFEVRDEAGLPAWEAESVGLREGGGTGFTLVKRPSEASASPDPSSVLAIPVPEGLVDAARRFFKEMQEAQQREGDQHPDSRPAREREHGPS